jgi:hypothetical protein
MDQTQGVAANRCAGESAEVCSTKSERTELTTVLHRRILDAQLKAAVEAPSLVTFSKDNPIVDAMLALLTRDGMGPDQL